MFWLVISVQAGFAAAAIAVLLGLLREALTRAAGFT
jgi:hypothetical protein